MKTLLLLLAACLPAAIAQPRDLYKVEITIRDSAEPAKNARKYSLLVFGQDKANLRVSSRTPVPNGSAGNFSYYDAGINLDCTVQEAVGRFGLHADLTLTSVFPPDKATGPAPAITSSVQLNITSAVTPAKPTVVAAFEDPVTSRKFDVEAVVTKL